MEDAIEVYMLLELLSVAAESSLTIKLPAPLPPLAIICILLFGIPFP
jgi:hypothetical protein